MDAIAESFDYCIIDCGDADPQETGFVSDDKAIIVLSCKGSSAHEVESLEAELHEFGFKEVIRLQPDREDLNVEKEAA